MAASCSFDLKVAGKEEAVLEFMRALEGDSKAGGFSWVGAVWAFETENWMTQQGPDGSGLVAMGGVGSCPYSIKYAMREGEPYGFESLEDISKRLGLVVEVFSTEPGNGFQEHFLVNQGEVLIDECVDDYKEYFVEDMSEEEISQLAEKHGISVGELMGKVNCNGEYCTGGIDGYAEFADLFLYLGDVQPSLDHVIQEADGKKAVQEYGAKTFDIDIER